MSHLEDNDAFDAAVAALFVAAFAFYGAVRLVLDLGEWLL